MRKIVEMISEGYNHYFSSFRHKFPVFEGSTSKIS
jgi:hypothetical protein